ncbi:hypothetical protein LMG22037_05930 [Paraburkholderia phenoliruptrix]|uniref:Uncharacterized protein n=1 Tax=Paraburkholderia phenoliruptrix TaxID=252970 RepID=A0A6J5CHB6_9BURK|nr:hypothetical protein [Paraburkholderia phenoliruptrix]CAB3735077.1 hypothetical protein LMG22037_05930 [Paraburkholderia phenoliruptrix]
MLKIMIALAAVGICGGAVAAEEFVPGNGTLLSVSTFTAGKASVQLQTWRSQAGHVCREYVKDVSYAPDGDVTKINLSAVCDNDKPL